MHMSYWDKAYNNKNVSYDKIGVCAWNKDIIVSLVDNTIGRVLYNFYEFYYDLL